MVTQFTLQRLVGSFNNFILFYMKDDINKKLLIMNFIILTLVAIITFIFSLIFFAV